MGQTAAVPEIVVPPRRTRLRFWLFPYRLRPLYRPWVAQQLTAPGYLRQAQRRQQLLVACLIFFPQAALAVAYRDPMPLVAPGAFLVVYLTGLALSRGTEAANLQLRRLLAYHGVTADGRLVAPSTWRHNVSLEPFGKLGTVLVVAQMTLLAIGGAAVIDQYPDRCRQVPAAYRTAIEKEIGRVVFGDQPVAPEAVPGTRLDASRMIRTGRVVAYVAGSVNGRIGIWRVFDLRGVVEDGNQAAVLRGQLVSVSPVGAESGLLTPALGYTSDPDPRITRVRDCTRSA